MKFMDGWCWISCISCGRYSGSELARRTWTARTFRAGRSVRMWRLSSSGGSAQDIDVVSVKQAAGTQLRQDFRESCSRDSEAAFAATQHAEMANDFVADVPGAVHHDPSGEGVVVAGIQSLQPQRMAVRSHVGLTGSVRARRTRIRPWRIRKSLQPAGMQGIGTAPMRDQM